MQPLSDGRYILKRVLGVGGMATVFLAWDNRLEVDRAIKVLLPELSQKANIRKRFESEARTMAKLFHPNIVAVHDVGVDADRAYIVMEMLPAGTLMEFVDRNGPMPPRMAVRVTIDLLNALEVAHAQGVVHRDIKPHNLLISGTGTVKVSDFGIAHVADEGKSMTKTGSVMGTWGFMSPEQRSSAKSVDARADIYACGATLYTLLTRLTPVDLFAAGLEPEMMDLVFDSLKPVIGKSTKYKAHDRYDSCADMRSALETIIPELPEVPEDYPSLDDGGFDPTAGMGGEIDEQIAQLKRDGSAETFAGGDFSRELSEEVTSDSISINMNSTLFVEEPLDDIEQLAATEPRVKVVRRGRFLVMVLLMVAGAGAVTVLWPTERMVVAQSSPEEPLVSPPELSVDLVEPVDLQPEPEVTDLVVDLDEVADSELTSVSPQPTEAARTLQQSQPIGVVRELVEDAPEPFYITQDDLSGVSSRVDESDVVPADVEFIVADVEPSDVEVEVLEEVFYPVALSGEVSWVALRAHQDSVEYTPPFDSLPAGDYNLVYRFGDSSEITYPDTVTVGDGGTRTIICDSAFQNCVPRG